MNKKLKYIKVLLLLMLFIAAGNKSFSQNNLPYGSDKPMLDPVLFELPGVENPWHFAFTPDGKTTYYLVDGGGMEVVNCSRFENGKWGSPQLPFFSGKYRIETPSISPDGTKFTFALPINIDSVDHVKLYQMEKIDTGWTTPKELGPEINIASFQNCPRIVNNGTFYFCSNKDRSFNIYRSELINGKYSKAEKLGSEIGEHPTSDFCIAADETYIIFEQHYNFYISFNDKGSWSKPRSLGSNINTADLEVRPYITPDGNYFFFKRLNPQTYIGPNFIMDLKPLVERIRKQVISYQEKINEENIARNKKTISSSNENEVLLPENMFDGLYSSRWASEYSDNQWFIVDLNRKETINSIVIHWEAEAEIYKIEISDDLNKWKEIFSSKNGSGGLEEVNFSPVETRFIKFTGLKRGSPYGFSIYEFEVFRDNNVKAWKQCKPLPGKMSPSTGVINKKIYAVKGCENDFKTPGYVSEYDPLKNEWSKKAPMPVVKNAFQTFVLNNKLYTIGGISDTAGTRSSSLEEYDPVTDTWKQKASMRLGREGIGLFINENKVYAFGGFKAKNDTETDQVELYNTEKDVWEIKSPMPTGRAWTRVCSLNNKIYVFGGFGNGRHQLAIEEYNPENDSWTKKKDAPHREPVQFAKTIDGNIYALFSIYQYGSKSFLEKYYPEEDTWIPLASPLINSFFDFASLNDIENIFICSGFQYTTNNVIKIVQRYNIPENKWERLPDLSYGRVAMGAEMIDNTLYIIGGQFGWYLQPAQYTDSMEKLELPGIDKNSKASK